MTASNLTTPRLNTAQSKHFDPILEDYRFFEEHASEMENDLRAYLARIADIIPDQERFRLLDFGAGTGSFTRAFLWHSDLHRRTKLDLTLVEPGEKARSLAWNKLRYFTGRPLRLLSRMPSGSEIPYDLILSNHALYYVANLTKTVDDLVVLCGTSGKVLATMAGKDNFLIRLWHYGYGLMNEVPTYYQAEHLEAVLEEKELDYYRETISYVLSFPDDTESRMKILGFLFGSRLSWLPVNPLLEYFDTHSRNGRILIETMHYLYQF